MAVSAFLFGLFVKSSMNKELNLNTDDIRVMLCTSTFTPNQDTMQYKSSVANEVTGTGYTAGGAALATKTVAYDGATNTFKFDADDTVWSTSTITARYAVIYDATPGTDATRPLIMLIDFGQDMVSTAGPFTLTWNAAGILTAVV
jgi:hypothetical protein